MEHIRIGIYYEEQRDQNICHWSPTRQVKHMIMLHISLHNINTPYSYVFLILIYLFHVTHDYYFVGLRLVAST